MRRHATLGYHQAGEFYYCTVYRQGSEFLGEQSDEKFDSHDSFAGLVTAVHEHYHLMQDMLLGYSWWRHETRDAFAAVVLKELGELVDSSLRYPLQDKPDEDAKYLVMDESDPLGWAKKHWLELRNIDRYTTRPSFTKSLFDAELQDSPELARFIHEYAYNLATIDLLECHAAVLTELYISMLIAEQPHRFNHRVTKAMAPLFWLNEMLEGYSRPLHILLHVLESCGIRPEFSEKGHPFYDQMTHGVVYFLLAFLLDYALHTPPEPLRLLQKFPDGGTQQDIYPPLRFFNLALLYAAQLVRGSKETTHILTSERMYYKEAAALLAKEVNHMHGLIRGEKPPTTFFSFDDTTHIWADQIAKSDVCRHFPETSRVRRNCWEFRRKEPDFWFKLKPASFDTSVELPIMILTPRGLVSMPYVRDKDSRMESMSPEEQMEYLKNMSTPHFQAMLAGGSWDAHEDIPTSVFPERFIRESMAREMTERLALTILFEGEMRCPLTESVGRYVPCNSRTPTCECIRDLQDVPATECLLRETGDRFFGRLDRFDKEN